MENKCGYILVKPSGVSEKEGVSVESKIIPEFSKEKKIMEILSYKLGISKDELFTYIDDL